MPQRSKITQLPPEIKAALDRMLIERGFGGYDAVAEAVNEQLAAAGYEITVSRSGLHRYGQDFEERLAAITMATEQARAVADAAKDDENAMNEALIRLVQTKAFEALTSAEGAAGLPKMGVMIAKLSKASVDQKKWAADARKKAIEEAANAVEATARQEGVSPETIQKIRRDILGMAANG